MKSGEKPSYKKLSLLFLYIGTGAVIGILSAAIIHRSVDMFFYCVFIGSIIGGASTLIIQINLRDTSKSEYVEDFSSTVLAVIVSALLSFSFLSTVPLNVDRSFSVWILKEMSLKTEPSTRDQLKSNAENFFSIQSGEIDRRIEEQLRLGNIQTLGQKLSLTNSGKMQAKLDKYIGKIFGLNEKYSG
jgi:hypothetical protein